MALAQVEPSSGRLGPHLAVALAIHAALFASTSIRPAEAVGNDPDPTTAAISALNVDLDPATVAPPAKPPGGGSPIAGASLVTVADMPLATARRKPRAAAPTPVSVLEPPRGDRVSTVVPDPPSDHAESTEGTPPSMAAAQASDDRRERELAMAAAVSAGMGRGAGGGAGGGGAGWGAPPIQGSTAFGNGTHGVLTGKVCFMAVGTKRIADVGHCPYVATIYTDTLDIPERHFHEGFPGVTDRSEWFLIDYTGTFSVARNGTYVFRLHSDDGSYLYIDDVMIIDNDGKHAPESRTGRVQLNPGEHRIKVRYAQTDDRMALQLFVRAPGESETIFTTQF